MIDLKKPDQRTPLSVIAKTSPSVTGNTTAATVQINVLRSDTQEMRIGEELAEIVEAR